MTAFTDRLCSYFRTEAEAAESAKAYLADEDLGCFFQIHAIRGTAYFQVSLFEADGHLIGTI